MPSQEVEIEWNKDLMTFDEFIDRLRKTDLPWSKAKFVGEVQAATDGKMNVTLVRAATNSGGSRG